MFCDGTLLSTVTLLLAQHEISSRFLKFVWKRLQPAQITPGSWLSIRVLPCQCRPIFVQVCNSCLMPKRVGCFHVFYYWCYWDFLLFFLVQKCLNYPFCIMSSLTICGKYLKKKNRDFATVWGLVSFYLPVIYQVINF